MKILTFLPEFPLKKLILPSLLLMVSSALMTADDLFRIPLSALSQRSNLIVPAPYPSFLAREIEIGKLPFNPEEIDFVQLIVPTQQGKEISAEIEGIWLE